jgi:hypothetical protein
MLFSAIFTGARAEAELAVGVKTGAVLDWAITVPVKAKHTAAIRVSVDLFMMLFLGD